MDRRKCKEFFSYTFYEAFSQCNLNVLACLNRLQLWFTIIQQVAAISLPFQCTTFVKHNPSGKSLSKTLQRTCTWKLIFQMCFNTHSYAIRTSLYSCIQKSTNWLRCFSNTSSSFRLDQWRNICQPVKAYLQRFRISYHWS